MNCREAEELFDLHVDGGLDAATSRILENHLQGCSSCRTAHDAVKAWHFIPARRGEERIQDWVKVPVVFRLVDAS